MSYTKISTYRSDKNNGKAEVKFDHLLQEYVIEYYDNKGHAFFFETFPNKSLRYVEDAAENWALGLKKLEESIDGSK